MTAYESRGIRSRDDKLFDACMYIIAGIVLIIVLYPLLFVVSASFSDPIHVIEGKVWLLPQGFTLEPYKHVFENDAIWQGYGNTLLYTLAGTFVNIILTVLAASRSHSVICQDVRSSWCLSRSRCFLAAA